MFIIIAYLFVGFILMVGVHRSKYRRIDLQLVSYLAIMLLWPIVLLGGIFLAIKEIKDG